MNVRGQYGRHASSRLMIGMSPEALKEELEELHGEIGALSNALTEQRIQVMTPTTAADQQRQSSLSAFFKARWTPFYNDWRRFYDEMKDEGFFGWQDTRRIEKQLSAYRSKLVDVRADAAVAGVLVPRMSAQPAPFLAPSPAPAPFQGPSPGPVPFQGPSPGPPPGPAPGEPPAKKATNTGLYVALGLGVLAAATATAIAMRKAT